MPGQNLNGKNTRTTGNLLSSKPVVFLLILLILSKSLRAMDCAKGFYFELSWPRIWSSTAYAMRR